MSKKLLSVVMPVCNAEKYLAEMLDSIFSAVSDGNREYVEFIFINDGSTDKTHDILEDYHTKYDFTLVHQANCGIAKTYCKLLELSSGKYFYLIEHDDMLVRGAIDKLIAILQENPDTDLFIFDFYALEDGAKTLYKCGCDFEQLDGQSVFCTLHSTGLYRTPMWDKVILKDLLVQNKIFVDNHMMLDIEIAPKLYSVAKKVSYLPIPLYIWRSVPDSFSRGKKFMAHITHSRLDTLDEFNSLIHNRNDLTDEFIAALHIEMSNLYISAMSGVRHNGNFDNRSIKRLEKYSWLLRYGKWDRKYIFRWIVQVLGVKALYWVRFSYN